MGGASKLKPPEIRTLQSSPCIYSTSRRQRLHFCKLRSLFSKCPVNKSDKIGDPHPKKALHKLRQNSILPCFFWQSISTSSNKWVGTLHALPDKHDSEVGQGEGPCTGPRTGWEPGRSTPLHSTHCSHCTRCPQLVGNRSSTETHTCTFCNRFEGCVFILWFPTILSQIPKYTEGSCF